MIAKSIWVSETKNDKHRDTYTMKKARGYPRASFFVYRFHFLLYSTSYGLEEYDPAFPQHN